MTRACRRAWPFAANVTGIFSVCRRILQREVMGISTLDLELTLLDRFKYVKMGTSTYIYAAFIYLGLKG